MLAPTLALQLALITAAAAVQAATDSFVNGGAAADAGAQRSKRTDLLIYNRVAKTGSSTMQTNIDSLRKQNGFWAGHYVQPPLMDCTKSCPPYNEQLKHLITYLSDEPASKGRNVVSETEASEGEFGFFSRDRQLGD